MRLYIVPGTPTLFYQQANHNSCILQLLASALHYMGHRYAPEYITRCKQKSLLEIQNKGRMNFCRDIIMGHHPKKRKKLNYRIEEWNTSTPYDIFRNQYNCTTVCLLLDTWHRTNHYIIFCGKLIFYSNFEVAFHSHRISLIIHVVVMTLVILNLLVSCMRLDHSP